MKLIKNAVIILFILCSVAFGQDIMPEDSILAHVSYTPFQEKISHVHFQCTLGFWELASVGVGYNIDINNALLFKVNTVPAWDESGIGYGLKYTYSIPEKKLIKNISICASLFTNWFNKINGVEGFSFEISTERKKVFHSWIVLQYEFGVMITQHHNHELGIWPTGNVGFNINF